MLFGYTWGQVLRFKTRFGTFIWVLIVTVCITLLFWGANQVRHLLYGTYFNSDELKECQSLCDSGARLVGLVYRHKATIGSFPSGFDEMNDVHREDRNAWDYIYTREEDEFTLWSRRCRFLLRYESKKGSWMVARWPDSSPRRL